MNARSDSARIARDDGSRAKPNLRTGAFSAARLERLRAILSRHVHGEALPGLVALVSRRGEQHVEALGTLAFDSPAPMQPDTIFRLASMTKPVTAVATMILVEECRLRLDEPVDPWLPELEARKVLRTPGSALDDTVPATRSITLRDLLTFRCGYGEAMFVAGDCPMTRALATARLPLAEWRFAGTPDEFMQRLSALPLLHQPGERWTYHMSAEILGVLIARVAGKPLGAFLRERIFEPLGMNDTGFHVPPAKLDRLAACYGGNASGETVALDDARAELFSRPPPFEAGAGGLLSTARDLAAFGGMLLAGGTHGHERILSRSAVELMTTEQLTTEQKAASPFFPHFWDTRGWGLGLGIVTRRADLGRNPGSFGWDGAFGTSMWIDPREHLVGVLMTQRRPNWLRAMEQVPVVQDFWTATYQAIDD